MRVFAGLEDLLAAVGEPLGATDWIAIGQDRIDRFAEATGDHQWIHVDPARAAAGPFGATIAHGYLTLSLVAHFLPQLYRVEGARMGINYGLNRVRFPAPAPVDSRLRASAELLDVADAGGAAQLIVGATIEREGSEKPVCVAETVSRIYFAGIQGDPGAG